MQSKAAPGQQYQQQLEAICNNASVSLFIMDERQHCTYMNPAAEELTGFTLAEVQGRPLHEFIHHTRPDGSHYPLEECPIDRAFPENNQEQGEDVFVHKDGSFYPVAFTASPIRQPDGLVVGTVIEVRNTTREREAQRALALQARVLDSMNEGVSVAEDNGIIIYTNPAEDEMFGYARGELIGKHVSIQNAYPPEENQQRVQEVIEQLKMDGQWTGTWENRRKDGSEFVTAATITAIESDGKQHWVCVQRDITADLRAQSALRQSEKLAAAGRLAATIAHEINNPLEAVMNLLFLLRSVPMQPPGPQYLDQAEAELARVAHLTRQTLGFYRDPTQPLMVDVSRLLADTAALYQRRAQARGVHLKVKESIDCHAFGYPGELRQVISNLLANALDASEAGGVVRARVRCMGHGVRVTVADMGNGISRAAMRHLFQPFFTTKKDVGTGLGLWVSKGIVEKHHGSIRVKSRTQHPRRGTVFSVFIPSTPQRMGPPE